MKNHWCFVEAETENIVVVERSRKNSERVSMSCWPSDSEVLQYDIALFTIEIRAQELLSQAR